MGVIQPAHTVKILEIRQQACASRYSREAQACEEKRRGCGDRIFYKWYVIHCVRSTAKNE